MALQVVSSNYQITNANQYILVDASGGPIDLTTPPVHLSGKRFFLKDSKGFASTNQIRIIGYGTQDVDAEEFYVFANDREAVVIESNGSDWYIV